MRKELYSCRRIDIAGLIDLMCRRSEKRGPASGDATSACADDSPRTLPTFALSTGEPADSVPVWLGVRAGPRSLSQFCAVCGRTRGFCSTIVGCTGGPADSVPVLLGIRASPMSLPQYCWVYGQARRFCSRIVGCTGEPADSVPELLGVRASPRTPYHYCWLYGRAGGSSLQSRPVKPLNYDCICAAYPCLT